MKRWMLGAACWFAAGAASAQAEENFYWNLTLPRIDELYLKTGLNGAGVRIGQIEPDLPLPDHKVFTGADLHLMSGSTTYDPHTTGVASLIIGKRLHPDDPFRGVAPGASLWSAWMGPDSLKPPNNQAFYDAFKKAIDWQIKEPKTTIVNLSWGATSTSPQTFKDTTDRLADWAVEKAGQLYVVGTGNDGELKGSGGDKTGNLFAPATGYNVLSVGNVDVKNKIYKTSSVGQAGKRTKPDLMAPGSDIVAATIFQDNKEALGGWWGTSFAAPLVSGTAGLLQQYGAKSPPFDAAVRNDPRLMRAVLMNSTNKTTQDRDGKRWDELFKNGAKGETNYSSQIGTGTLDAMQAYEQYKAGPKGPTFGVGQTKKDVGEIGWDVRTLADGKGLEKSNDYRTSLLRKGTILTSTVCWNVGVITQDGNGKDLGTAAWTYDKVPQIFLSVSGDGAADTLLSTSDAKDASSQHNLYRAGERNRYYIRVYNGADSPLQGTKYGLAWRGFEMETSKVQSFNGGFDGDRGAYRDNGWYAAANTVVAHKVLNEAWMAGGENNWAAALGDGTGASSGIAQELVRPLTYFNVEFDVAVSSLDPSAALHLLLGGIEVIPGGQVLAVSLGGVDSFVHFAFSLDNFSIASLTGDFTEISFVASGGNATFYLDNIEYVPGPGGSVVVLAGALGIRRKRAA